MEKSRAIELLKLAVPIKALTQQEYADFVEAVNMGMDALEQPVATDTNVGDKISKFIDGLEEIFADLRERHVDDSVCGLCEYDGAYMGQSGDWCNECPGFDRDDCFKLSDKTRKEWTEEIIKALPTVQPEKAKLLMQGTTKDATSDTIQPETKEGKWEQVSAQRYFTSASYIYRCSVCGENNLRNTKYCPNCGSYNGGERK